jgi:glycosyltransferase involved in cell wall biosynthesis
MNGQQITLVVPVYNASIYVHRFVESLSSQQFTNFLCVFIYDESDDETLSLLTKELKSHSSLAASIIKKPMREGVGKARDYALDNGLIKTDYAIFVDIDDLPHPDYLSKLYDSITKNDSDIAFCGYRRVSSATQKTISIEMVKNPVVINDPLSSSILLYLNPAPWNKLIRTSIISDARFVCRGGAGEDAMFFLRIIPRCSHLSFVNKDLYEYYVNPGSVSSLTDYSAYSESQKGYLNVKEYYLTNYGNDKRSKELLDAFVFMRFGIGVTTRTVLNDRKSQKKILADSRRYLDTNFNGWRRNKRLSFVKSLKNGPKTIMVWGCKMLYILHLFPIFLSCYRLYTKAFHKDIRW